jgi:hypothetical protein
MNKFFPPPSLDREDSGFPSDDWFARYLATLRGLLCVHKSAGSEPWPLPPHFTKTVNLTSVFIIISCPQVGSRGGEPWSAQLLISRLFKDTAQVSWEQVHERWSHRRPVSWRRVWNHIERRRNHNQDGRFPGRGSNPVRSGNKPDTFQLYKCTATKNSNKFITT